MRTKLAATLALALCAGSIAAQPAAAKGPGSMISPGGIALPGSPYRYLTISPGYPDKLTVVARVNRRGGKVTRWWHMRGGWYVPGVAMDGTAGGLSADGRRLVLVKHEPYSHARGRAETKLAIMRPTVSLRRAPGTGPPHWVDIVRLPGEWAVLAISPDGATLFLSRHPARVEKIREGLYRPLEGPDDLEVRALDTTSGRLLPGPVLDRDGEDRRLDGLAWTQVASRDGRWTYTLYAGDRSLPYVYALDSALGRGTRIDLRQMAGVREPYSLKLSLTEASNRLVISRRWRPQRRMVTRPLLTIDTASFAVRRPEPQASISRWWLLQPDAFLSFASTPRRPGNLLGRLGVAGRSTAGRPIRLRQFGDPAVAGSVLVFGCIHGGECAARRLEPRFVKTGGCPDPRTDLLFVRNLDPDGLALGTRLNARGVDLNRNFPVAWRPLGERGDPKYSGPRPFSEPETRLAARIVRTVEPEVTVWFHQHHGPGAYVRAWGQSAPAGRRFARLARIPFRLMPWLAGTAPNWQNHRFPGTASFVVELPAGELDEGLGGRLGAAIVLLGRKVGED